MHYAKTPNPIIQYRNSYAQSLFSILYSLHVMLCNHVPLVKSSKKIMKAFHDAALLYLYLTAYTNKGEKVTSERHLTLTAYHLPPIGNIRPHSTLRLLAFTLEFYSVPVATY